MKKLSRVSVTEQPLPFQLDPEPAPEILTAFGGLPMVVQVFRSMRLPQAVGQHVQIKERQRGYDEATFVESFVVLNAAGGECLEDFERLREDTGLAEMLGHAMPSPEAARKFLYEFHDESKIEASNQQMSLGDLTAIPDESRPLRGLAATNREFIAEFARRCADQKIATVDQDATIIESHKREARMTYEGERGYQPMLAVWAETDLILADQFRDGHVPSVKDPLVVAQAAFQALPSTVKEYYYRGDSAFHEHRLVEWLLEPERADGPKGFIGFAISARMSPQLKQAVLRIAEPSWEPCPGKAEDEDIRQCAEVDFVQWLPTENRQSRPVRYIALRIRKKQGELFSDGTTVKHFAVVTNLFNWKMQKLIQWHREKAGSVERINDVLKNELSAGVLPCGRFGANAAWLRMAILTHNVLTVLKRIGLPAEYLSARPKRLRFMFFHLPGRLVHHARGVWLRLTTTIQRLADFAQFPDLFPITP